MKSSAAPPPPVSKMETWPLPPTDVSSTAWQKDASGNAKRSLNYTVTINNPLVGKFSAATETQVCLRSPGLVKWFRGDSSLFARRLRRCTKIPETVITTSWTRRCTLTTSPTTTTSTSTTGTTSSAPPSGSVDSGEPPPSRPPCLLRLFHFHPTGLFDVDCATRVYTNVKYKKQPWGLVKSFITKNSWSSIEDNFRQLGM